MVLTTGLRLLLTNARLISSNTRYMHGTIRRVNMVELISPPITVMARGDHRLACSLLSSAIGRRAKTVVQVVIIIGLNLSCEAFIVACIKVIMLPFLSLFI